MGQNMQNFQILLVIYMSGGFGSRFASAQTSPISQLRSLILPKIPQESYLFDIIKHDDLYLEKWLKSSSHDVHKAQSRILDHFRWRASENIDNLSGMDWSYFQNDFVTVTGHHDKTGRPLAEMWLSEWDVRRAILAGRRPQLTRWITRIVEQQQRELYEARKDGRNVTHATLLIDVDGFNFVSHGCPQCLQVFTFWGIEWETQYPDLYQDVLVVNVTPAFQVLISTLKAALRTNTMRAFQPYTVRQRWLPVIDAMIDRNERSVRFGGTLRV